METFLNAMRMRKRLLLSPALLCILPYHDVDHYVYYILYSHIHPAMRNSTSASNAAYAGQLREGKYPYNDGFNTS